MVIKLYHTSSEPEALTKDLSGELVLNGAFRDQPDVLEPTILVELENPTSYNYVHIPEFGRYYFMSTPRSIRTNLWEISLRCDVLMSHRDGILNSEVLLITMENPVDDTDVPYIDGDAFLPNSKKKTDVLTFPNGFNSSGEYILITAGGL